MDRTFSPRHRGWHFCTVFTFTLGVAQGCYGNGPLALTIHGDESGLQPSPSQGAIFATRFSVTQGVAQGWYGAGPLALFIRRFSTHAHDPRRTGNVNRRVVIPLANPGPF